MLCFLYFQVSYDDLCNSEWGIYQGLLFRLYYRMYEVGVNINKLVKQL